MAAFDDMPAPPRDPVFAQHMGLHRPQAAPQQGGGGAFGLLDGLGSLTSGLTGQGGPFAMLGGGSGEGAEANEADEGFGTWIGRGIGAVGGFFMGGPMGAYQGFQMGGQLGGAIDRAT